MLAAADGPRASAVRTLRALLIRRAPRRATGEKRLNRCRKRPAIALSLAAIVLAAFLPAQAAPAHTARTAARLNHLLHRFTDTHPSFPGVALAVRTPKLSWAGAAGVADRATG